MNRDDVIRWATQCKMPYDFVTGEIVQIEKLERFAALVAAAAKAEERENVAMQAWSMVLSLTDSDTADQVLTAIRARKENT